MTDRAFSSAVRSRLRGAGSFRRLLKQLPGAVHDELAELLDDAGSDYLAAMKADVPVRTGAVKGALRKQLLRKSLRLRVGLPPQVLRGGRIDLFYARIVEFGRKAQTVNVTRGDRAPFRMRVRAMAPQPFVFKRRAALRQSLNTKIRTFWDRTLADTSEGIGFE